MLCASATAKGKPPTTSGARRAHGAVRPLERPGFAAVPADCAWHWGPGLATEPVARQPGCETTRNRFPMLAPARFGFFRLKSHFRCTFCARSKQHQVCVGTIALTCPTSTRRREAMSDHDSDTGDVPLIQQLLDNPFLLLFLGVLIPMVVYTLWGVIDILTIPLAK
jgi:hypothetical protein